jgi:hypothetical protein
MLVPKIANYRTFNDYKPINLINGIFMMILKTLTNKMREVIGCVISSNKLAFIKGRNIIK